MTSSGSATDGRRSEFPTCRHCGKGLRPYSGTHPWRHVETGKPECAARTKADPVTLQAKDAPAYLGDLLRTAGHHLEQAHALLTSVEQIMAKMADGEVYNL